MNYVEQAKKLRPIIEKAMASVDDETALSSVELFPTLKGVGELVKAGTRINWNGKIYRASVDLWDTPENTPDTAPTLWAEIVLAEDNYRVIPDVITAELAFALGEKGWWKDKLYESLLTANVWTPDQYPNGWKLVE